MKGKLFRLPFLFLPVVKPAKHTYKKHERLKSRKDIERVFKKGHALKAFPVLAKFADSPATGEPSDLKAAVVVPRRKIQKSCDRNLLKRRMREAYRKNKSLLLPVMEKQSAGIHLVLIYTGEKIENYSHIEDKIILILNRLVEELNEA